MKNPNGYGTVSIIDRKSRRRKPYRVQVFVEWTDEGKPIKKTVGYARTRAEGKQMLAKYHDEPFDLDMNNVTFEYLFDKWYEYKKTTRIGDKAKKKYLSIRKKYDIIENKAFNDITRSDLQMVVDESGVNADYQSRILNLYRQMYKFAKGNNIKVGNDVSMFVNIPEREESTMHKPFTDDEINLLWANRNDVIDLVLIDIYTGVRPGELLVISEIHDNYFVTGLKTESGKNRVVPLNHKIKDIFHSSVEKGLLKKYKTSDNLYQAWKKEFERLGIGSHTPYDCRHTFATLMDRAKADEHSIKLIMGHRINDLTKRVYTHKLIEDLITEINKI